MSGTNTYAAKRALFALLGPALLPTYPDIVVSYAVPAEMGTVCVYGGGVRFDHTDAVAESPGIMVRETASCSLYIRVLQRPIGPIEDGDDKCAAILNTIAGILKARPTLGPYQWLGLQAGLGDYSISENESVSILSVSVVIGSMFAYGGA